jgi:hypothetical protein
MVIVGRHPLTNSDKHSGNPLPTHKQEWALQSSPKTAIGRSMKAAERIEGKPKKAMPELAFYYPNPIWTNGDWIKNLILFFDGIALLVPKYMKRRIEDVDPAIVTGLTQHHLLHVIEPEKAVDKSASKALSAAMTDIIASGALDSLARENTAFHELSMSRLGYVGDAQLAENIFKLLEKRGLARATEDGVSIPMHPLVRSLVLTLLSQILRSHGGKMDAELSPVTDRPRLVESLIEMLNLPNAPSNGNVVAFDLATVGVDLAAVPIDEILSFRNENKDPYQRYRRSVRSFAYELSQMPKEERARRFEERQAELDDLAADLRSKARRAWKKPASFALMLAGAVWKYHGGDALGAVLTAAGAALGLEKSKSKEVGAYSYLFRAHEKYS